MFDTHDLLLHLLAYCMIGSELVAELPEKFQPMHSMPSSLSLDPKRNYDQRF